MNNDDNIKDVKRLELLVEGKRKRESKAKIAYAYCAEKSIRRRI
jgi:hypothetical protein